MSTFTRRFWPVSLITRRRSTVGLSPREGASVSVHPRDGVLSVAASCRPRRGRRGRRGPRCHRRCPRRSGSRAHELRVGPRAADLALGLGALGPVGLERRSGARRRSALRRRGRGRGPSRSRGGRPGDGRYASSAAVAATAASLLYFSLGRFLPFGSRGLSSPSHPGVQWATRQPARASDKSATRVTARKTRSLPPMRRYCGLPT